MLLQIVQIAATSDSGTGSAWGGFVIVLIIVAIVIAVRWTHARNLRIGRERMRIGLNAVGADGYFPMGTIVAGVPASAGHAVVCAVSSDDLVFWPDLTKAKNPVGTESVAPTEVLRIPRDGIDFVGVKDATETQKHVQVVQRLTATRMAFLGPLSLAVPQRNTVENTTTIEKFYLIIDWTDDDGTDQETIFQFGNGIAANSAESAIRDARKTKIERLKPGEKKCPMCAETIRAEAVKCRYCGADQ